MKNNEDDESNDSGAKDNIKSSLVCSKAASTQEKANMFLNQQLSLHRKSETTDIRPMLQKEKKHTVPRKQIILAWSNTEKGWCKRRQRMRSVKIRWKMPIAWAKQFVSAPKNSEIKECVLVFCATIKEESGEKKNDTSLTIGFLQLVTCMPHIKKAARAMLHFRFNFQIHHTCFNAINTNALQENTCVVLTILWMKGPNDAHAIHATAW